MLKDVLRNQNPGPGQYEFDQLHTFSHNYYLQAGDRSKLDDNDKSVPVVDNRVPGPGAYDPDDHLPIPNFKISQPQPETKQHQEWISQTEVKKPVGPHSYTPVGHPDWRKGVKIGNSLRHEENGSFTKSPAPNRYQILGDFDFRDPTNPEKTAGKVPKFAFGINLPVKTRNMDVPGPGTYETDTYPMNQQNIAHWIGTDVRKPLSVRNSHMYPGPGNYEHFDNNPGPFIG